MYLLSLSTILLSTYSFVVKLGLPAGRLENKGKGHTGQSHGTVLFKDTCSPDTKGTRMQSQPNGLRMGSGLGKDNVGLDCGLDKADPRGALDTDKDAGDQARLFPKWTWDAGLGMGAGQVQGGPLRL
ncbi:hypothetical protein B0H14DRAFT_2590821 [Mycena olivaceomarginata]|nr:hypothetical protein B0H14DRAFT_2590821 [Mycena olivaceomarginata]